MSGVGRDDVLAVVLAAGRRLGLAQARAMVRGDNHADVLRVYAETIALADELARIDPVAGGVVREAVHAQLAGDMIEGTASDVVAPGLLGAT